MTVSKTEVKATQEFLGDTTHMSQHPRAEQLLNKLVERGWVSPKRWKVSQEGAHTITDGKLRISVRGPFGTGTRAPAAHELLDILNEGDIELPH